MTVAIKHDDEKARWHLLPWDAVREIVFVLMSGAKKYGEFNWANGMDWSRLHDALLRHLTDWWAGEDKDPETGRSHLAHAGCCLLFLLAYSARGLGRDDRPANHITTHTIKADTPSGRARPRICSTCRHCHIKGNDTPCAVCDDYSKWEEELE